VDVAQAAGRSGRWGGGRALTGRRVERTLLDQLVGQVARSGTSRALVIHGEAGVGKSALLDYVAGHAHGCTVLRAGGVQSEMELPFAGLHQLCASLLDQVGALPAPQRQALQVAFGLSEGAPPERFVIGLGVLGLLSHVAADRPLICLIDDQQWLDRCSAQVLGFVARRLGAESVGMVFATRDQDPGGDGEGWRSWRSPACPKPRPANCSTRCSPSRSTSGCATRSSPRPAATRWPCSSCPGS
jgi:hypothetical protein